MSYPQLLILLGGILFGTGLITVLLSNHYASRVIDEANPGVAIIAPDEEGPERRERVWLRKFEDRIFYLGIILTGLGVILLTWGGIASMT